MKYFLIILLSIVSIFFMFGSPAPTYIKPSTNIDTVPGNVAPQLFGSKLYEFLNYQLVDSFLMVKGGDTFAIPRWPAMKYKTADNRWYGYHGTRWRAFLNGTDTVSLSNRINAYTYLEGIIYTGQSGTFNLSSFSTRGATPSISSGGITFSGGANNLAQTLDLDTTMRARYFVHIEQRVGTINSTSDGNLIGIRSVNPSYTPGFALGLILNNTGNAGKILLLDALDASVKATSTSAITFTTGDTVAYEFDRELYSLKIKAWNKTQNTTPIYLDYTWNVSTGSFVLPNTGTFSIFHLGGNHIITNYQVISKEPKNAPLLCLGDSKTVGYYSGNTGSYPFLLNRLFWPTIVHAGAGDRIDELNATFDEIALLTPVNVTISIGSNDIGSGQTVAQVFTKYKNYVARLNAIGTNVYHLLPFYQPSIISELDALSDSIRNYYPATKIIDCRTPIRNCPSCYLNADNVHLNLAGDSLVATTVVNSGLLKDYYKPIYDFIPDTSILATKYDLTQPQEQLLGTIYNKNSWTNTSDFTTSGVTATVVSNKIQVTPTADGNYTSILGYTPPTSLEHYKIALKYRVGAITSTSAGVGIGVSSVNTYSAPSVLATIGFTTGSTTNKPIKFQVNNASPTFVDVTQTAGGISASQNDYILLTFERNGLTVTYTVQNLTTNGSQIIGSYLFEIGPTPYCHNTGRFNIWANGGSFTIDSLAITSTEVTRSSVMFIGDSKTVGAVEYTTLANRFGNLIGNHYKSFVVEAGGGDRTTEVLARMNEILALNPKVVMLGIGSNDKRSGMSDAAFQANYTAISNALTNAGIDVYYLLPFYETQVDLTSQRTWILATFPADKVIDTWTPMTIPGSLYSDNVHPTDSGHFRIADAILEKFKIREGRVNTGLTGTDNYIPVFNSNTLINSFAYQQGAGANASTIFNSSLVTTGGGAGHTIFSRDGVDKFAIYSPSAADGLYILDKVASQNRLTINGSNGYVTIPNIALFGANIASLSTPLTFGTNGPAPLILLRNNTSGTDQGVWNWAADANQLVLQMLNDPVNAGSNLLIFKDRTSYTAANAYFPLSDVIIGSNSDAGSYKLQNTGGLYQNGPVTMNLGSDATGDIYYRNSGGNLTRLPIGSTNQILKVSSGLPAWGNALDTVFSSNVAYVDVNGNNTTGTLNNPAKPFLTLDAALDALPIAGGKVQIGLGEFMAPDTAKIKSNVWFAGSGMPRYNDVTTVIGILNTTTTSPTKMIGGTIIHGTFLIPYNRNNVDMSDLGVDNGSDWVNANNGGTALDCILYAQQFGPGGNSADGFHMLQTSTNPRTGINVWNVAALCKSSTDLVHGILFENMMNPNVNNIYSCFGFAGIVIKTIGGVYTNLHGRGHSTGGVFLKSNDYSYCTDVIVQGCELGSIGSFDGAGLRIDANDAGSPGVFFCSISNLVAHKTTFGIKSVGGIIDNLVINNSMADETQSHGFDLAPLYYSSIGNCSSRSCGGDGFHLVSATSGKGPFINNCIAASNAGDGFDLSGPLRIDLENIYTEANTGYGINTSDTATYIGIHREFNNTAGPINGTYNTKLTIDNGGTGNVVLTPYSVLTGGTTSTGALQQVSGTGTSGQVLTSNGASALPSWQAPSSTTTIYTGDGTLSANRTVSTGGFTTTWTGSNDNETSFSVANTGTTNASAILGSATGTTSIGVSGTSSSYLGVFGSSTTNTGIQGQSSSGTGVIGVSTSGAAFRGQINPSSTNAFENVTTLLRTTSSGGGANGIGAAIQFELETATNGTSQTAGSIGFQFTDATNATRTSQFEIYGVNSAASARKAALAGSGQWTWDGYGAGTHTGTPTYSLQTTSAGAIIEGPLIASGTWSPTLTDGANSSGAAVSAGRYTRIGNIVTFSLTFTTTTSAGASATVVSATLPISSNFTTTSQASGTNSGLRGSVNSDGTNDVLTINWTSDTGGSETVTITGQYIIL